MKRAFSTPRHGQADGAPAVIGQAVRQVGRIDRSEVSLRDGLVAAIPVVAVLTAGTAFGDRIAAVTMAAGAMLVGVAWRAGGGRPPLATMATTTAVMGLSTFAGAATGQHAGLHFAVVAVWSFVAGLLVAVGPRGGTVGLQAIIAIIVFGRFPQPLPAAAGLAGLVVAGGCVQVLFCALVGLSPGLRPQRAALAAAYRRLASLAASGGSSLPVSAGLDDAQATLNSPALIGDAAVMAFSNLVTEARRIRLELVGLQLLTDQYGRAAQTTMRSCASDRPPGHSAVHSTRWPQRPNTTRQSWPREWWSMPRPSPDRCAQLSVSPLVFVRKRECHWGSQLGRRTADCLEFH
jgi:FUSC-like inner membrane protein yccS